LPSLPTPPYRPDTDEDPIMGIFSRMGDIINSNLNAMLDRAEDPEKIVRLIVQEMEDTLVEARTAAAKSIAEKKELHRKIEQLETAQADWQAKAELAVSKDRDDLAKGALVARAKAADAAEALKAELVQVEAALAKTNEDMAQLQAKLSEAKQKQKAMEIRRKSAQERIRVRTQLHDGRIDDALSRYEMVERKLDELEGHAEAFDLGRGPGKSLEEEFAELESEGKVDEELAALKQRLAGGAKPAAGDKTPGSDKA
jgi:phage shock protein A